jgi:hypothetical protein
MRRIRPPGQSEANAREPVGAGSERKPLEDGALEGRVQEGTLLELQRSAGNRAVGSLLAREADKAEAADAERSATIVFPDPIGALVVESYKLGKGSSELEVSVASSAADPLLVEAANRGTLYKTLSVSTSYLDVKVFDAIISSVQLSGGSVHFILNGTVAMDTPKKPQGAIDR